MHRTILCRRPLWDYWTNHSRFALRIVVVDMPPTDWQNVKLESQSEDKIKRLLDDISGFMNTIADHQEWEHGSLVQRCFDDALRAINDCLRRIRDHESRGKSGGVDLASEDGSRICCRYTPELRQHFQATQWNWSTHFTFHVLEETFDRALNIKIDWGVQNVQTIVDGQELRSTCDKLSKIDFAETQNHHWDQVTEGTAEWIFNTSELKSWMAREVTNLWIVICSKLDHAIYFLVQ